MTLDVGIFWQKKSGDCMILIPDDTWMSVFPDKAWQLMSNILGSYRIYKGGFLNKSILTATPEFQKCFLSSRALYWTTAKTNIEMSN